MTATDPPCLDPGDPCTVGLIQLLAALGDLDRATRKTEPGDPPRDELTRDKHALRLFLDRCAESLPAPLGQRGPR